MHPSGRSFMHSSSQVMQFVPVVVRQHFDAIWDQKSNSHFLKTLGNTNFCLCIRKCRRYIIIFNSFRIPGHTVGTCGIETTMVEFILDFLDIWSQIFRGKFEVSRA